MVEANTMFLDFFWPSLLIIVVICVSWSLFGIVWFPCTFQFNHLILISSYLFVLFPFVSWLSWSHLCSPQPILSHCSLTVPHLMSLCCISCFILVVLVLRALCLLLRHPISLCLICFSCVPTCCPSPRNPVQIFNLLSPWVKYQR